MEATPEQTAQGLGIVRVLSIVLDRLVGANDTIARADPGQVTKFHAMKAPGIGVQQYLERVHKYASCSNECFILALIYIDRLIQRNNFLLTELNVHRVVITAILLAAKFFDDAYYNNAYYAKVGGVLVSEMNGLEVDFLFRINFSLHVTPEIFEKYRAELLSHSETTPDNVTVYMQMETEQAAVPQSPMHHAVHHQQQAMLQAQPAPMANIAGGAAMMMTTHSDVLRAATQITPSPPREAARVVDAQHGANGMMVQGGQPAAAGYNFYHETNLLPMQRANSMPVEVKSSPGSYYHAQCSSGPVRCAQNSLSAPPMIAAGYTAQQNDAHFQAMPNQVYPLQTQLIHHNHAGFQRPTNGGYQRDGAQRLISGAGL